MVPTEASFLDALKQNPTYMWGALLAATIALVLALSALIAVAKLARLALVLGAAAIVAGLAPIGLGSAGMRAYLDRAEAALAAPGIGAKDKARMKTYSEAVAGQSWKLGLGLGAAPITLGAIAILASLRRRR
jgi:hypothetical protein